MPDSLSADKAYDIDAIIGHLAANEIQAVILHVGMLSSATAIKQQDAHPEMTVAEYAAAQAVINGATNKVQDTPKSMIYIREEASEEAGGHVLVVKATKTGAGLWVTSYRRLSRQEATRDAEISRLLAKENK